MTSISSTIRSILHIVHFLGLLFNVVVYIVQNLALNFLFRLTINFVFVYQFENLFLLSTTLSFLYP